MLSRRSLAAALPFAFTTTAAAASGGGEEGKKDEKPVLDLQPIALPVAVNGKLINYVFVHLRLNPAPGADMSKLRSREPWIRDAIVRAGHRTPFTVPTDYTRIDEARLKAALMREAGAVAGAKSFVSAQVMNQTPKQRNRLPRPPA
jgi:hypothetical protein